MRDILETNKVEPTQSEQIISHLENETERGSELPSYRDEQEKILTYRIIEERNQLPDLSGQIQVALYPSGEITGKGDRFAVESYFPESSYE